VYKRHYKNGVCETNDIGEKEYTYIYISIVVIETARFLGAADKIESSGKLIINLLVYRKTIGAAKGTIKFRHRKNRRKVVIYNFFYGQHAVFRTYSPAIFARFPIDILFSD